MTRQEAAWHRPASGRVPCGACGRVPTYCCYKLVHLCHLCKRLATAWCWRKIQGAGPEQVRPQGGDAEQGQAYPCDLCGCWHWTRNTGEPVPGQMEAVARLTRYFRQEGFRIDEARGYDRRAR